MRYTKKIALLSTLSTVALLTASATSIAFAPAITDMGLLRQQDAWHVGSVDTQTASYCAMVNQFEKGVSLAFARNPDGYGSLAISFPGDALEAGKSYDVTLQVDDQDIRRYSFNAPSTRSAIIQISQNDDFYSSLAGNGTLRVSLPTVDMSFDLKQFSGSYISLVGCAEKLAQGHDQTGPKTAAMPVTPVEKSSIETARHEADVAKTTADNNARAVKESQNLTDSLKTEKEILQAKLAEKSTQYDALQKQVIDMVGMYKSEKDQSAQAHSELEASGQRLFQAQTQLVDLKHAQSAAVTDLQSKLAEKTAQYETLQKQYIDMGGMYRSEKERATQEHAALEASNQRILLIQAQLTEAQAKLTAKTAQYDDLQKQYMDAEAARMSEKQKVAQTSTELESARQGLTRTQAQLTFLEQQKGQMTAQIQNQGQQSKTLLEKVQAQLDNSRRQLSMLESQIMTVALQKDELSAELESQRQKNRLLQASLDAKQREITLSRPAYFPETTQAAGSPAMAKPSRSPVFAMIPPSGASSLPPPLSSRNGGNKGSVPAIRGSSDPSSDNWDTVVIQ